MNRLHALAATGLVAGSLTMLSTGTAHAVPAPTPQVIAAEQWVADTLGGPGSDHVDLLPSKSGGANYGASADAIMSLESVGYGSVAETIAGALRSGIDGYIAGEGFGDAGSTYSGATAKAAAAFEAAGIDPATVDTHLGGTDAGTLLARLEGAVKPSGRLADTSTFGDYANTLGQAFGANALDAAGSADAAKVTSFLLTQQCDGGWFRQSFTATATYPDPQVQDDTSCGADPTSTPSVDATATAVIELLPQKDDNAQVARAIGRAESWLLAAQQADGGWVDAAAPGSNANSTGLAVRALGALGHTAAAQKGAAWLRGVQLTNTESCVPFKPDSQGAIAVSHGDWKGAQSKGVATNLNGFVVAASQALPALQWVPTTAPAPAVTGPTGFRAAGGKVSVAVKGAEPGQAICLTSSDETLESLVSANTAGAVSTSVTLPGRTGSYTVSATTNDGHGWARHVTFSVLAAKKLYPKLSAKTVKIGKKETVSVTGLAAREKVSVTLRGARISGSATSTGTFKATFTVRGKPGSSPAKVTGQFANRTGTVTVKVVKAS